MATQNSERRLRSMLDEQPQDAELKLLLAIAIHTKYVMSGPRLFARGTETCTKDEDDIETLVTEALPYIRHNPEYAIMAGKLLYFLRRGYDELGRDLCEDAYASSVSIADSIAIIGQMRAFFGETDFALESIEQALRQTRSGTHAHAYALIIKTQVLVAAARWDELSSAKSEMWGINAILSLIFEPFLCHPDQLSLRAKTVMLFMSQSRATGFLKHRHYIGARLFRDPQHGANTLASFARLTLRRFGPDSIPAEIARAFPGLLDDHF